jgi:4-amino-4-deoxy-L-arabinose transferase-like glycosyltransferase
MMLSGGLCLVALAERNGYLLQQHWLIVSVDAHGQMLLLIMGVALLLASGARGSIRSLGALGWHERYHILALLGILGIGLLLRLWQLEREVPALVDEGPFMVAVTRLRDQPFNAVLKPMEKIASFTHVYAYAQWWTTSIFGAGLFALRFVSVIFGTLTIAATYWLTRTLFRQPRLALIAALLLATFPPHIHFSRLGLNNIADPLFGTLALACLVHALRSQWRGWYGAAGVFVGLLPYFYEAGELVLPTLIFIWLIGLMFWGREKARWRGLLWMLAMAAFVALPVYYTLYANHQPFFTRLEARGIPEDFFVKVLFDPEGVKWLSFFIQYQLLPPFAHYLLTPDGSTFYGGQTALILPLLVPIFGLGLWRTWRLSRRALALLLIWLILTAVGNSLIYDPAWSARFVVTFPALVIVLAAGLEAIQHFSLSAFQQKKQLLGRAGAVFLVGLIAVGQVAYYFGAHLPAYRQQIASLIAFDDVMWRVEKMPAGTQAYLLHTDYTQAYYAPFWYAYRNSAAQLTMVAPEAFDPATLTQPEPAAIFISPRNTITIANLEKSLALLPPIAPSDPYVAPEHAFVLYWAVPH